MTEDLVRIDQIDLSHEVICVTRPNQGRRISRHQTPNRLGPDWTAKDYKIRSGPTEAFCKMLTASLKESGMRGEKPITALASVPSGGLWKKRWHDQKDYPHDLQNV